MEKLVSVAAPSEDILQVQRTLPPGPEAERLANAVAKEYIRIRDGGQHQGNRLRRVGAPTTVVPAHEPDPATSEPDQRHHDTPRHRGPLIAQRAAGLRQLGHCERGATADLPRNRQHQHPDRIGPEFGHLAVDAPGSPAPCSVATFFQAPSKSSIALTGVAGLIAGLLVGIIVALVRGRRDRRLFTRYEISTAIGVPVLASLHADRQDTSDEWSALFETYAPDGVDAWNLRNILRETVTDGPVTPSQIRVVSLQGDAAALAVGPQLALFANRTGTPVDFAADAHPFLQNLLAVSTLRHPFVSETSEKVNGIPGPVVIRTVVFDPAEPTLETFAGPCVLAVSAGFASADELGQLALAAADSGKGLDGMVVVNPYPSDNTTGVPRIVVPESASSGGGCSPG